jgi:hypothetical protein
MVFHVGYNKKQGVRGYGISRGIQQWYIYVYLKSLNNLHKKL